MANRLTERQREVLQHLVDGTYITRAEIARHMRLSEGTVKHHLENARRVLGAKNRTHAVAIALKRGMVRCRGVGQP